MLGGTIEIDEVYVVAGHKGNPKNRFVPREDGAKESAQGRQGSRDVSERKPTLYLGWFNAG